MRRKTTDMDLPFLSRPWRVFGFIAVVALLAGGSFWAGSMIHAPEDQAVSSAQDRVPVTAAVQQRVVGGQITLQGTVMEGASYEILPVQPAGVDRMVVTQTFVVTGQSVSPGQLLATVSGRPVIVMESSIPLYRNLKSNDEGDDVKALQLALSRLGYPILSINGKVTDSTLDAVRALYRDIGSTPPGGKGEGTMVDWHEFVQIPADKGTIRTIAPPGTTLTATDPLARLQVAPNVITARADVVQGDKFKVGQAVNLQAQNSAPVQGVVGAIGAFQEAGKDSLKSPGVDVIINLPETSDWKAAIPVTVATIQDEKPSLAVPLIALRQDGQGQYVLLAVNPDPTSGSPTPASENPSRVDVKVTAQDSGWAAIAENDRLTPSTTIQVSP